MAASLSAADQRLEVGDGDLDLEGLYAVDLHHRDPVAVVAGELVRGVHIDLLQEERVPFSDALERGARDVAQVTPAACVEDDPRHGPRG
jgi:hypothetical protein